MNRLYNNLFDTKRLLLFIGLALVVFIISLYNRYIYIDDAWFGEQAYWFLKNGFVKVQTIPGFHGWDEHLLVYHKLSIIIGALLIKVFGWSANTLRIFSLIIYLLSFIVLSRFFKNNRDTFSSKHFVLAAFIVFFNPLTLLYSYTYRPETLVSLLGFSSFIYLDLFLIKSPKSKYLIFAGLLAGLAFFTHLNGMIFGIAGFFVLVLMKKPVPAFIFGIFTVITASFYFYDLWQPGNFQLFLSQIDHWPDPNASNYAAGGFWDLLIRIIGKIGNEHQRFFWSYKVWAVSSLFVLALILKWRKVIKIKRHLLLYLLLLILSLNIFGSQIAERFLIYFFPYMAIIISVLLFDLKNAARGRVQGMVISLLLLQFVCVGIMFNDIFSQNDNYTDQHKEIMLMVPDRASPVLVNYRTVFNELENHQLITYKGFEYHQVELGRKMRQNEFLQRASNFGIKSIIIPYEMLSGSDSRFPCLMDGEIEENPWFEMYYSVPGYRILKAKE
ncbi:MAG: hypothetical protein B6D64_05030 [Bacteroidetes bacterium 4484_276]|nr:MAG: hypothetical protein B6D64_05030 [Bacteroidetes bacterium 4484_276]